jgi:hypothetical protein
MKYVLWIVGGLVGLYLLYLLLRRPAYVAPVATRTPGGIWGTVASALGVGVASAINASKSNPQSGVIVVGQGLPGYGNNSVVYMPSANTAWQSNQAAQRADWTSSSGDSYQNTKQYAYQNSPFADASQSGGGTAGLQAYMNSNAMGEDYIG